MLVIITAGVPPSRRSPESVLPCAKVENLETGDAGNWRIAVLEGEQRGLGFDGMGRDERFDDRTGDSFRGAGRGDSGGLGVVVLTGQKQRERRQVILKLAKL